METRTSRSDVSAQLWCTDFFLLSFFGGELGCPVKGRNSKMKCLGGDERAWALSTHDVSSPGAVWEHSGCATGVYGTHCEGCVLVHGSHCEIGCTDHIVRICNLGMDHTDCEGIRCIDFPSLFL